MLSAIAAVITLFLGAALLAGGAILALSEREDFDWFHLLGVALCGVFGFSLCFTAIRSVGIF